MGDFASVIGSGPIVGLDDIPSDLNGYYRIVSANIDLDLADHTGSNIIDAGNSAFNTGVTAGSGNDYMMGGFGDDTLTAGGGRDSLSGGEGDDVLSGGDGADLVQAGIGDDTIRGDAGNDSLSGGAGSDLVRGGRGNDVVEGDVGDDVLFGDVGDDTVRGGSGDDALYGNDGSDWLSGGLGDDLLDGGKGSDTLAGGAGDETLIGGLGSDTFLFESNFGDDVIADFAGGKDQIWLQANINNSGITNPLDLQNFVSGNSNSTVITIGEDSIRLEGVGKDDFLSHLNQWVKIV